MAILEVQHIEKHFGATEVLKDISFSLEQGAGPGHHRLLRQRQDHPAALPEFSGDARQGPDRRQGEDHL